MELKFLVFTFVVLCATFGSIESKWFSRSRGSSSSNRGSSSSSNRGSSSSNRGSSSSSNRGSSSSNRGSSSYKPTGSTFSNHNTFINNERAHSSSGHNTHGTSSHGSNPFQHASAPPLTHNQNSYGTSSHGSNPFQHASAPPLSHNNNNNNSPLRPFGAVPPPKHTVPAVSNNNSPVRPFGTVPPPKHNAGLNHGYKPPVTSMPIPSHPVHTGTRNPTISQTRPHNSGHHNTSTGSLPPPPGFIIPTHTRPPTSVVTPKPSHNYGYHNKSTVSHPTAPVEATRYPIQSNHPGSHTVYPGSVNPNPNPGINYPRQPAWNPSYHTAYPGYQPSHGYIQPTQNHVYHHVGQSLPPNPGPTYVIVPGQSYTSSRGTGDIFKEALIHAGVNAAVHRITSPSHYHDYHNHNSWNSYGSSQSAPIPNSNTNTYVTNNYYGQSPGAVENGMATGSNFPGDYPSRTNPSGSIQNGYQPQEGIIPKGSSGNFNSQSSPDSASFPAGVVIPQIPSNGQSHPSISNGQSHPSISNGQSHPNISNGNSPQSTDNHVPGVISDQELHNIMEKLFSIDENNAYNFITMNLQHQTAQNNTNITDMSPQPLFVVRPEAYEIPTIRAIRSLYQITTEGENNTCKNCRRQQALLVDLLLNTNVMIAAMNFLSNKSLIKGEYYEHKDTLKRIWFTPYDGSSSAFKRVFQGEVVDKEILYGIQDWITLNFQEKAGRANYLSYTHKIDLGNSKASILKLNYEMDKITKNGSAVFVGTSPELEFALYTICMYTRPNNYCSVSLGGTQFMIYTHTFLYFGHDLIDLAFPII